MTTHSNMRAQMRDLLIEADLHGMSEEEAARLFFCASWQCLRSRKRHAVAMEQVQIWLDELAANPSSGLSERAQ